MRRRAFSGVYIKAPFGLPRLQGLIDCVNWAAIMKYYVCKMWDSFSHSLEIE